MAKTITIEEALKLIKDNDKIAVGDGTVEPQSFLPPSASLPLFPVPR